MPRGSSSGLSVSKEIEVAGAAARDAGAWLRAACDGGGLVAATAAAVEIAAEDLIRTRLAEAFPEDGFRGEKTGDAPPRVAGATAGTRRIWLVDANDAATACLAGRRGAAVSLALLVGARPVLGVVYVFNAPDDRGDLIPCDEAGVLRRNGAPALPVRSPEGLAPVVLLPPAAAACEEETVRTLAPLRFRCAPGVASRLALAAVGEGDAAVVVQGAPTSVLAAGQVILAGAGIDLVDSSGEPLAFTPEPTCSARGHVFAGAPATVARLRSLDWSFLGLPQRTTAGPLPDRAASDPGVLARAQGCLLGQLCGDALGSLVPADTPATIIWSRPRGVRELADGGPFKLLAGQPSAGSEQALLLARTLVAADRYHAESAWSAYESWFVSRPFTQGATMTRALCGTPDGQSQENGALTRVGPLGVYGAGRDPRQVALWAREDAALTHPHAVCCDASALFAAAIAVAVAEGPAPEALYDRIVGWTQAWAVEPSVKVAILGAAVGVPDDYLTHRDWVLVALRNALWQLLAAPSCEAALVDTVERGGDTGANAAVCGALLGAVHGRDAIPARWRRLVLSCRPLRRATGVRQPRPPEMWPTDALELAEALVASGDRTRAVVGT